MSLIIAAGGTAGHLFPALAIAQAWKKAQKKPVYFIGSDYGMETTLIPQYHYPLYTLPIRGFYRKQWYKNFPLLWRIPVSVYKAYRLINKLKPRLIIGTGGYASFPIILCAYLQRRPFILYEPNCYPGLVTRLFSAKAYELWCNTEEVLKWLPKVKRYKVIGVPLRETFLTSVDKAAAYRFFGLSSEKKTVLVLGGSLGAKPINDAVAQWTTSLPSNIQVLWQTGKRYYAQYKHLEKPRIKVVPFIDAMEKAYAIADFVIARSGAITTAELLHFSKPALLIPSPYVAENHQYWNALALYRKGGYVVWLQKLLSQLSYFLPRYLEEASLEVMKKRITTHKRIATNQWLYQWFLHHG